MHLCAENTFLYFQIFHHRFFLHLDGSHSVLPGSNLQGARKPFLKNGGKTKQIGKIITQIDLSLMLCPHTLKSLRKEKEIVLFPCTSARPFQPKNPMKPFWRREKDVSNNLPSYHSCQYFFISCAQPCSPLRSSRSSRRRRGSSPPRSCRCRRRGPRGTRRCCHSRPRRRRTGTAPCSTRPRPPGRSSSTLETMHFSLWIFF